MLISGNDTFVTYPYLMSDEYNWDVKVVNLSNQVPPKKAKNNDFTKLSIYLYIIHSNKPTPPYFYFLYCNKFNSVTELFPPSKMPQRQFICEFGLFFD